MGIMAIHRGDVNPEGITANVIETQTQNSLEMAVCDCKAAPALRVLDEVPVSSDYLLLAR